MRPTRIEEGFAVAIETELDPAAIVLARLRSRRVRLAPRVGRRRLSGPGLSAFGPAP
jgi:hypothetical protein